MWTWHPGGTQNGMRRIAPISPTPTRPGAQGAAEPRPAARGAEPVARGAARTRDRPGIPVLDGRPGGVHERVARALGDRHPVTTFLVTVLGGLLVIGALSVLLGLLVVHVLAGPLGLGTPDNGFIRTLAGHRTTTLTDASSVGSASGGGLVLPVIVGVVALAAAAVRHWRVAAFAVFALATESATYRITTLFIHRDRPHVHRLESLPVGAGYPSGHTAASVAVYSGLVLLLTSRFTDSTFRALAWTFAILMTTFVALSRMYRGMHHPLDVAGGITVGIGAVLVVLIACRAAGAAADARRPTRARA